MRKAILVINAGSSSIKFSLFEEKKRVLQGEVEEIGTENSSFTVNKNTKKISCASYEEGLSYISELLHKEKVTVIGIGYRVVFGGNVFSTPIRIDDKALEELEKLTSFAPLHMPYEVTIIRLMRKMFSQACHVACFDTAFHTTMKKQAKVYPLPREMREKGIQRYGFHGLSYEYIAQQEEVCEKKAVVAHLGSGCSLCAMDKGRSMDTSMGLTPLGGIPMCTRTGNLDPGILFYLIREGINPKKLEELCERKSGLLGLSGKSKDMKVLLQDTSEEAQFAIEYFCYEVAKAIGAYSTSLQGIDTLVFTAGIGEKASSVREKICAYLNFLDVLLDEEANKSNARIISSKESQINVCVIPTDEEIVIAQNVDHYINSKSS